jgi:hypothetical protein
VAYKPRDWVVRLNATYECPSADASSGTIVHNALKLLFDGIQESQRVIRRSLSGMCPSLLSSLLMLSDLVALHGHHAEARPCEVVESFLAAAPGTSYLEEAFQACLEVAGMAYRLAVSRLDLGEGRGGRASVLRPCSEVETACSLA